MIAQMTARFPLRVDKAVVGAVTIFLLGWICCSAVYRIDELSWLRFRSAELSEVQQAVAPASSTRTAVAKTKELVRDAKIASAVGCIQPTP